MTDQQTKYLKDKFFQDWNKYNTSIETWKWIESNCLNKSEWISVKDELPKHKQKVIMFCNREFKDQSPIVIGFYNAGDYENWISYDFNEDEKSDITHWQPLLQPPKSK